jgi:hypothetical protein
VSRISFTSREPQAVQRARWMIWLRRVCGGRRVMSIVA